MGGLRDRKSKGHSANERGKFEGVKRVRMVMLAVSGGKRGSTRTMRAFDWEYWECGCYEGLTVLT
jgi:hypothetical protein